MEKLNVASQPWHHPEHGQDIDHAERDANWQTPPKSLRNIAPIQSQAAADIVVLTRPHGETQVRENLRRKLNDRLHLKREDGSA